MSFFTRQLRAVVLLLAAVLAVGVSAEDALFHNLGGGGSDLAWLKVEGAGFGQYNSVSGGGASGGSVTSVGFLFPVKGDFYYGLYYTKVGIMESGMFKGFDFIGGFANHVLVDDYDIEEGDNYADISVGLGYALGYDVSLVENLHALIGSSLGFYFEYVTEDKGGIERETNCFNFLAPFIKIQYSWIEIAYRGLVGYYTTKGNVTVGSGRNTISQDFKDSGFDWTRHLLTIGFCFGRNK